MKPDISVVTPSYQMLPFLRGCAASVADQREVRVEHIVVDNRSTDGTAEWLAGRPDIVSRIEADRGMYDAVNKGLRLARGEILAYLNCDEQYLPGALAGVHRFFAAHPHVDVLFGDFLVVAPDGRLIAYRKGFSPRWPYIFASYLYTYSCTMFFRRRLLEAGFFFDETLRLAGDAEWVVRVLRAGYRAAHRSEYTSLFIDSGGNLSHGDQARQRSFAEYRPAMPAWVSWTRPLLKMGFYGERLCRGTFHQRFPLSYAMYPVGMEGERVGFNAPQGTFRWPFS